MNTKLIIAATVAALSLATTAFAAEGNGNPFPFRAPGETTYTTQAVRDTGTSQYPYANPALSVPSLAQATLPENGAQGSVETANSLPLNAMVGTVAYARGQSEQRWFAQQDAHRFALQQARSLRPNG